MISLRAYNIHSVLWRYIIDRFVIDVCLKTIVAKKEMRTFLWNALNVFMPLRALQVLKFFFILTVADISCFARQFCFMIRSRKERHFLHHAMVQTLFIFYQSLFFISLSLSLSQLSYLFLINPVPFCVFTQHSILHFFFFRRLWSFYTSNHATYSTHAVCKKLEFKRVLTLSLRMTGI